MKILNILLSITFILMVSPIIAQPPPPPATPIDGGLSILLAAGGIYGVKKIRDKVKGN